MKHQDNKSQEGNNKKAREISQILLTPRMGSSGATGTPDQALGTLAMDDDILASKGER